MVILVYWYIGILVLWCCWGNSDVGQYWLHDVNVGAKPKAEIVERIKPARDGGDCTVTPFPSTSQDCYDMPFGYASRQ